MIITEPLASLDETVGLEVKNLLGEVLAGAKLTEKQAAYLLSHNRDKLRESLGNELYRLSSPYTNEERNPHASYPPEYSILSLQAQAEMLTGYFPDLDPSVALRYAEDVYPTWDLPEWVEGPFLVPRWEKMASTYGSACAVIIEAIAKTREIQAIKDRLDANVIRQHQKTKLLWKELCDMQPESDIIVVPAQFGFYQRARSVRRVRTILAPQEFGLGLFHCLCMLLTHTGRLLEGEEWIWIEVSGDECYYGPHGWECVMYLYSHHHSIRFGSYGSFNVQLQSSSATAFLPAVS